MPGIKFGLAFCEASGETLVRWSGTDEAMIDLAKTNALALSAGHSFIVFLAEGFYPINVLNAIKAVPEVARVFCATANPTEVIIAETEQGRGILGVIDGARTKGIEDDAGIAWRKGLLRAIGYKPRAAGAHRVLGGRRRQGPGALVAGPGQPLRALL